MAGPQTLAAMHAVIDDNASGNITPADVRLVSEGLYSIYQDATPPVSGDFSWVNQGGASVTVDSRGHILLDAPSDGTGPGQMRVRVKTAPSTPYNIKVCFDALLTNDSEFWAGLVFRDSGDGQMVSVGTYGYDGGLGLVVGHWTDHDTYAGTQVNLAYMANPRFWRIRDDGTDLHAYFSLNGETWKEFWTDTRTDLITSGPNQVGFFINPVNLGGDDPLGGQMLLRSWVQD
jgi:hypothetical protein